MATPTDRTVTLAICLAGATLLGSCKAAPTSAPGEKVLRFPLRARLGNLDPARVNSQMV